MRIRIPAGNDHIECKQILLYLAGSIDFNSMADLQTKYINLLWQSFLKGDDKSFAIIYQQFAPGLISFGYRFNVDHELVHDSLQEVFIDLYLKREKLDIKIDKLRGYLFIALKNSILKKISKEKKLDLLDFEEGKNESLFEIEYSFQDQLISKEISAEVKTKLRNAISNLSSKQKEIIFLKFEEELTYPEISKILNITIDSARKQFYRAIKTLRELLDPESFSSFLFVFSKKISKNCPYPVN